MKTRKNKLSVPLFLFLLFVLYTFSLTVVDVQKIGPQHSEVGFATMNQYFQNMIGANSFWYQVTEIGGMSLLAIIGYFLLCGLQQWYKRKKISLVDKKIVYLGFLYVVSAVAYLFFEKVIINSRPILVDQQLEASYPSSHTFLTIVVLLSTFYIWNEGSKLKRVLSYLCILGMFVMVVGRRGSLDIRYPWRNIVRSFICFILRGSIERE
ncbi:hypothetical protein P7D97_20010 [Enterococcus raffinosus]|uniref:hypothetical protein n=1 Tax=Enterococcus raffinosus TaxID=71452 RepID=UPI001FD26605|nr:hypothetical protein [Enterococcus raffinosus]MDT2573888.1 hypothetical protein [Enterococcus raffinosus]